MKDVQPLHMTYNPYWFCLRTRVKHEKAALRTLRTELDLEMFCPQIRFKRARESSVRWTTEALFPGYLFARFVYPEFYLRVQSSQGVSEIVSFGGMPAVVPNDIIDTLRDAITTDETIVIDSGPEAGDEVEVVDGVFRGIRAVVTRVNSSRQRVGILIEILGQSREVEVPQDAVIVDDSLRPVASGVRKKP